LIYGAIVQFINYIQITSKLVASCIEECRSHVLLFYIFHNLSSYFCFGYFQGINNEQLSSFVKYLHRQRGWLRILTKHVGATPHMLEAFPPLFEGMLQ